MLFLDNRLFLEYLFARIIAKENNSKCFLNIIGLKMLIKLMFEISKSIDLNESESRIV